MLQLKGPQELHDVKQVAAQFHRLAKQWHPDAWGKVGEGGEGQGQGEHGGQGGV